MDERAERSVDQRFQVFLRSRWPARARLIALYALGGSPVLALADLAFGRFLPAPPAPVEIAAMRLVWMLLPAAWLLLRLPAGSHLLPPLAIATAVAWTWGNAWAYFALGLDGSVIQALALVLCFMTAATFLPLRLGGRLAVFGLMAAGQLLLDLGWPGGGPLGPRLASDAAVFAVAAVLVVVFENFAASQRRGLSLRRHLEKTVAELEASRAQAAGAAQAVVRLAAHVAHEVNNPLSAVKVNVGWLGAEVASADPVERAEVVLETVSAVERIARSVAELKRKATDYLPAERGRGPGRDA